MSSSGTVLLVTLSQGLGFLVRVPVTRNVVTGQSGHHVSRAAAPPKKMALGSQHHTARARTSNESSTAKETLNSPSKGHLGIQAVWGCDEWNDLAGIVPLGFAGVPSTPTGI